MSFSNEAPSNLGNKNDDNNVKINNESNISSKEEIYNKEKIYELKHIKFIIKDYSSIPRTERAKIIRYLINIPMTIVDFKEKFGFIIHGFKISPEPKNFDNTMQIMITEKTDICFYYLEYRLLFFFDLSQSMLLFDLRQKILNIQKIEKYLNLLLKSSAEYEDTFYNLNIDKINYKPKIICTIACATNVEEIIFIKHAFILEKEKFENFYSKEISDKINLILMKYHDKRRSQGSNENLDEILFLYKILENCLLTFNLMPSSGNRILFLLTDGNIFLPNLGKYNNILMQLNRADISIQIIDMFYRNNCIGLTSPKFVNDIEIMKYLAKFTGGNYINENLFIKLFFPKERGDDKNKKDRFFYPSLYPNILSYNINLQESEDLWKKRFEDVFDEKHLHCENCSKGFELFLCKKLEVENNKNKNDEFVLYNKTKIEDLINNGINIKSIGLLSDYKKSVIIKELFESYKINKSLALIIESRLRESFYFKKTKNPKKIKFINYLLPSIMIKYNLTKLTNTLLCRDFQVDIIIKGEISKITQMKKELYTNKGKSEKVELLLNFIKQVICTDKITLYFSEITHHINFPEKDFFSKNENYISKLSSLPVRNWHRYFNVMICEIFIINNTVEIDKEFIYNFLKSQDDATNRNEEKKDYLKKKILSFCDDYNEEKNFGIKKIFKDENIKDKLAHNGFLLINFNWTYKNLCIVYLGFFHCFLTIRNKYYNKFKEFIINNNDNNNEFIVECNDWKHLTYFLTDQKKEDNLIINNDYKRISGSLKYKVNYLYTSLKQVEDYKNIVNNVFTYCASEKLMDVYLKKYPQFYEITTDQESTLKNILEKLILQRLKENFRILNWNSKQMIFFSYFNNLIIEDPLFNNIKNNPLLNNIIVLYSIKIEEQKNGKLVISKLIFEPNENLYLLNNNENNIKSEEEKNNEINFPKNNSYFKAIMKYFEQDKIRIRKSIKINVKYDDNIENYVNNDIDI